MWKPSPVAALLWVAACAHAAPAEVIPDPTPSVRYSVTIFDNFGGARVRACFDGFAPRALVPLVRSAGRNLTSASSPTGTVRVADGEIVFPRDEHTKCVDYSTRFYGETFRSSNPPAVVVSQSRWLWRPQPFPSELVISLDVAVPKGARASLPFAGGPSSYILERDALYRDSYTVFGVFPEARFVAGDVAVRVALLGPYPSEAQVRSWLRRAIGVAASIGGAFPVDRIHFVVVPIPSTDRPVAFGMVRRGGGTSVILIPSSSATPTALESDWVAIHELSHLWMPVLGPSDRWLTEGIATYLQELLLARCGLQSPDVSWTRIYEGLERGRRSGAGRSLSHESREMTRTGAYHRVYWSGTAFAIEADVRLRRTSSGKMTLTRALALAYPRVEASRQPMRASEFLALLDAATGTDFLVDLGARYQASLRVPETGFLDRQVPNPVRDEIMSADPDRCLLTDESSR